MAIRHLARNPQGGQLTAEEVAGRANALLKWTFVALQHVSLVSLGIGTVTEAARILLHLGQDRPRRLPTVTYAYREWLPMGRLYIPISPSTLGHSRARLMEEG